MNNFTKLLFSITLLLTFSSTYAQEKIAHINLDQLLKEMPETVLANKQLEKQKEAYKLDLTQIYEKFEKKKENMLSEKLSKSESLER